VTIAGTIRPRTIAPAEASVESNLSSILWANHPWRWFFGCWLAGSVFLAVRLVRGIFAVRRWIRLATPCRDPQIETALSRAAQTIGVRKPELLWSEAFESPALVMLGRARLLLPAEMPADIDWFAVFCHELAHRARRDDLSRLLVELSVIALPWQPLLWVVRRQFRAACEEACDDWAIAAGADPVEFASLLVALVPERRPAFALGMAESPSATRHRILRLLAMQGAVYPRLGMLVGAAGWVAAIGLAITLAMLQHNSGPGPHGPIRLVPAAGAVRGDNAGPRTFQDSNINRPAAPPWGNTPLAEVIAKAASDLPKSSGPPAAYVVDVPDILLIDAVKLVPKSPYHIEPLDVLQIQVANPLIDQPITGPYALDPAGTVELGPQYGKVLVAGQTIDEARTTIETHLRTVLRDPAVSVSLSQTSGQQQIAGEHLVGPDGTVNMGTYGAVYVAGLTVAEIKAAVEAHLSKYLEQPRVSVEVFAYNSHVYYVVIEGLSAGDTITRVPITGKESVLDALAQPTEKIPNLANCWVWISRPPVGSGSENRILPVDWQAVLTGSDTTSNWRIMPGDRIFVRPKGKTARAMALETLEPTAEETAEATTNARAATDHPVWVAMDGIVDEVLVTGGDSVKRGQVLAKLRNLDLEASIIEMQGNLDVATGKTRELYTALNKKGGNGQDQGRIEAGIQEQRLLTARYEAQRDVLKKKQAQLMITSPVDGQIRADFQRENLLHRPVRQGLNLMTVVESSGTEPPQKPADSSASPPPTD
jgi:polysaccharide export outer membrane protein